MTDSDRGATLRRFPPRTTAVPLCVASHPTQMRCYSASVSRLLHAPFEDAAGELRLQLDLNPQRIGIMGFSAGGHLASSAGTHFQNNYYEPKDAIDKVSCRPDFMVLLYPVITMEDAYTHKGSKRNLLGENPDQKLVDNLSNEKQVTDKTPPTFLVHSNQDTTVPAENSVFFYLALRKAGVPAEMHIYQNGPHGTAIEKKFGVISTWPDRCTDWMKVRGLLNTENN